MDARTLLLGDWSRVVRDPIDLIRLGLLGATIAVAATGGHWTNLAVSTAATFAVRPAELPRVYDLSFCLAMALSGLGDALGAYEALGFFDSIVHVLVPLFVSPVVYVLLARIEVLPDPARPTERHHLVGIFAVTLAFGLAIGALWEIFEWSSDQVAGSNLSLGQSDTIGDLVADGCGAAAGAALLVVWAVYGWGSVRRIPGENRREDRDA